MTPVPSSSPEEAVTEPLRTTLLRTVGIALILGTASTVVGGFLVARIARSIPYFNALAYGGLGMVLSTLTTGELPTWFRAVGIGLTVPASLLGAYFAVTLLSSIMLPFETYFYASGAIEDGW